MIRAERDGGERVDHIDGDTGQCAAQKPQPVGAGHVAHEEADERADGGQTLQTDVDHTGPLAIKLGKRNEQHGDGQTDSCQK